MPNPEFSVGQTITWSKEALLPAYRHLLINYGEGPFTVTAVKQHPKGQQVQIGVTSDYSDGWLNADWFVLA